VRFGQPAATAFAAPEPVANHRPGRCPYSDADARTVDCVASAAAIASLDALRLDRLPVPAIEAEDAVSLGDGKPPLDIAEFLVLGGPASNALWADTASQRR
jgi:hypothetical protein